MSDINFAHEAARLETIAARQADIVIDIEDFDTAELALDELRNAMKIEDEAGHLVDIQTKEERKIIRSAGEKFKKAIATSRSTATKIRQGLLTWMLNDRDKAVAAAAAAAREEIERIVGPDDSAPVELSEDGIVQPQPIPSSLEGVHLSRRRKLTLVDPIALAHAVASRQLPPEVLAINDSAALKVLSSGRHVVGVEVTEKVILVVSNNQE